MIESSPLAEGVTQQFKLVILEQRFCFDIFDMFKALVP